jgi:hypothetical protein
MALAETIAVITSRLQQGRYPNEQAILQGIVLRLLQELGWDVYDTNVIRPEFQTGEGRADFARCHPPFKPAVFVGVKQPVKAEDGVRQALEYAFHTGVPFIVLTDDKTWSFYLCAEQGSYEDRRVYKLDIFERTDVEAAVVLAKYLSRTKVESGECLEIARKEYRGRNRRSIARQAISEAWNELVQKGDELLVDLVASAVESNAGVRPEDDDVADFLANLGLTAVIQNTIPEKTSKHTIPQGSRAVSLLPQKTGSSNTQWNLILKGKSYPYTNAEDAMIIALTELAKTDPTFLQRCSLHPDCYGKKRKYIARQADELYPDRPDLREFHAVLPGGWLVATNLNNQLKRSIIKAATQVAGMIYGKDVLVAF